MITIIILNHKTPQLTSDCISTLSADLPENCNVVVVDNCSNDDSIAKIRNHLDNSVSDTRFQLLENTKNRGFAAGNNFGISNCAGDYVVLANSDTLFREKAVRRLIDAAEANPDFGFFSPRLEWPNGEAQASCFRFHRPVTEFLAAARTGPISRWLTKYVVSLPISDQQTQPEWTSFACVLIRQQIFDDVGLLDKGFFMYFEDVEFCHRARQAGWNVLNVPSAKVVHLRGGSSSVKKDTLQRKRLPRYYYASRTRYYYLIYGRSGLLLANLLWIAGRTISKAREFIERRETHIPDKQWRDIWTNWHDPLQGVPPVPNPQKSP